MTAAGILTLLPIVASMAISFGVGIFCWRRREKKGAAVYGAVAFSQAAWTFGYFCELLTPSLEGKLFWDNMQYIGVAGWGVSFLFFTTIFVDNWTRRARLVCGALSLIFVAIVPIAFLDGWLHLVRTDPVLVDSSPFPALVYGFPPLVYVYFLTTYVAFMGSLGVLLRKTVSAKGLFRAQLVPVLIGNGIPLLGTTLTLAGLLPPELRDISPYTFAIGNLIVAWGLSRSQLFDITPLAWDRVVEDLKEAVIVIDTRHRIVGLNPAACAMADCQERDALGQHVGNVFPIFPESMSLQITESPSRLEISRSSVTGTQYLEIRSQPLFDRGGRIKGRSLVCSDVSSQRLAAEELEKHRNHLSELVDEKTAELRRANDQLKRQVVEREGLEMQLHHAQKMEAIGRLAGGISHDFNNLLVPIMTLSDIMLSQMAEDDPLREDLQQIRLASQQAKDLTSQILAVSRRQVMSLRSVDINTVVADFSQSVGRLIGHHIRLEQRLAVDGILPVMADRGKLEQVLMNLTVNARDAMPNGGVLTIETANVTEKGSDESAVSEERPPGAYIMVSVRDTGHGMSEDVIQHIFEPFFTTKPVGEGTGLGMATVFGIIKQHGGFIRVRSAPGHGADIRFFLPATTEAVAQPAAMKADVSTGDDFGDETVFVVEDEAKVRNSVCRALRIHGYKVLECDNPHDAITLMEEYPDVIDMLLTDVVMPGMNGRELYEAASRIRPNIRPLYMSGDTQNIALQRGSTDAKPDFIQKPFSLKVLTHTVRRLLDSET